MSSEPSLFEVIRARRSVRHYTPEPVPAATLSRLVDAAIRAPSATNEQPWEFSIVRDRALLARLSRRPKAHLLADGQARRLPGTLATLLRDENYDIFHGAPALVVIAGARASPWVTEECALAAGHLMLAATALGLGTCWIGLAQAYLEMPEGKHEIGLPVQSVPVAPLVVGYPVAMTPETAREPPSIRWVGGTGN